MKDDRLYLDHILERIERIQEFTREGRDEFFASVLIQDAVLRSFEVMGEAAKKASDDLRQQNPHIPWRQMIAFRNILIHDYVNVDLQRAWQIVEQQLPLLKPQISASFNNLMKF